MYIVIGLFLIAYGIIALIRPETIFELYESWKSSSEAEPSDRYNLYTRTSAVISLIVGIAGIVISFIN